jgi:PAS domain S-box-containing protein
MLPIENLRNRQEARKRRGIEMKKPLVKKENRHSQMRQDAEGKIAQAKGSSRQMKEKTPDKLIHELQVHQIELEMQNEELRKTHLVLEDIKDRYIDLYDFAPVGYFTFSDDGLIKDVNLTGAALLGIARIKLINRGFGYFVTPEDLELWDRHIMSVLQNEERQTSELWIKLDDGSNLYVRLGSIRIETKDGNYMVHTAMNDITERKRAEEKIQAALKEKEILLREIHHRVKNNMQIISSLLRLQSKYIKDKEYRVLFEESQNTIRSMSLIHEKLYNSEDISKVDFKEYIGDLVNSLFHSYGVNTSLITTKINIENVSLGIDFAIPCGLIINELITNSLKYAFPDGRKGEIKIAFSKINENIYELFVGDNGIGIPEEIDIGNTESLGLRLVTMLVNDQLEGEIYLKRNNGTKFRIVFKGVNI